MCASSWVRHETQPAFVVAEVVGAVGRHCPDGDEGKRQRRGVAVRLVVGVDDHDLDSADLLPVARLVPRQDLARHGRGLARHGFVALGKVHRDLIGGHRMEVVRGRVGGGVRGARRKDQEEGGREKSWEGRLVGPRACGSQPDIAAHDALFLAPHPPSLAPGRRMRRGAAGRPRSRRRRAGDAGRRASRPGPCAAADDGGRRAHRSRRTPRAARARAGAPRGGGPRRHGRGPRLAACRTPPAPSGGSPERFLGMVLRRAGDPAWIVPAFERDRGLEQIRRGDGRAVLAGGRVALRPGGDGRSPIAAPRRANRHRGDPVLRVLRRHRPGPARGEALKRHPGHGRVPDGEERPRAPRSCVARAPSPWRPTAPCSRRSPRA